MPPQSGTTAFIWLAKRGTIVLMLASWEKLLTAVDAPITRTCGVGGGPAEALSGAASITNIAAALIWGRSLGDDSPRDARRLSVSVPRTKFPPLLEVADSGT